MERMVCIDKDVICFWWDLVLGYVRRLLVKMGVGGVGDGEGGGDMFGGGGLWGNMFIGFLSVFEGGVG